MARLDQLRIDRKKAASGVWIGYALGIELKIARIGNPNYVLKLAALASGIRPDLRGLANSTIMQDLVKQSIAETVLVGWKNLTDDEDKPIKYSGKKALEMLKDPELADLYDFIVEFSTNMENFRKDRLEAAAKN
jgi:hypothetical protein